MEQLLRIPTDGAGGWWEEIAITTHLRIAVGACALSACLLVGSAGAGIAAADTDSETSAGSSQTVEGPSTSTTTPRPVRGPISTIADSLRKAVQDSWQSTVQGVTGTLTSLAKPGGASGIPESPKTTFGGSPTVYGSTGPSASVTDPVPSTDALAPVTEALAPVTEALSPATEAVTPVTEPVVPVTESVTPVSGPVAPVSQSSPPPSTTPPVAIPTVAPLPFQSNPFLAAWNAAAPVTNALTVFANTVIKVPGVIVALPTSTAPVTDVLTTIQSLLTSATDAGVSLSQLPSDLTQLLGIPVATPTVTIGAGVRQPQVAATPTAPVATPGWSALPQLPVVALPSVAGAPALAPLPSLVTPLDVTTTGILRGETGTGSALVVGKGAAANDVLSTVEHVIGAFVATVSLTALAAVALPGILGLLTTCAAGIRVGYRQAKAGSVLPNTVVSRFVGSGPIGVVRSGAQVELRSRAPRLVRAITHAEAPKRALHVVRPEPAASAGLLEQAV
ncbi:hypothetical protein TUM20983_35590 [Mycobacterium antarcticum]|nr:hypothetical protein TUM20983_35590 [Mycolicibacterium sp. TUM20983]